MIDRISIDGVVYALTPTEAPALGDKVITVDGVIYVIGDRIVEAVAEADGEVDRTRVNGNTYDLRDKVILSQVNANTYAIANEATRAKAAEQANADAISAEVTRAQQAEQALNDRIDNIPTGGGGTGDIADGAVTERKLSNDVKDKLNTAYNKANLADTLFVNDGITFIQGAYNSKGEDFHPGTNFVATSLAFQPNGERITVNDGYVITRYFLMYNGDVADFGDVQSNYFDTGDFAGTEELGYRIEIRKSNDTAINASEYPNIVKSFIRKPIVWSASCNMNNFICAGRYVISGSREANAQDNLPIYNGGKIEARLEVLENENTLVQILTLLNVGGGDGNIYTRVKQNGSWGIWGKLQTNIEVGRVEGNNPFDNFIDNGMYSGVYAYGYTAETFVLVVINAYLYGGGVAQLKYSTLLDGTTTVQIRTRVNGSWGEWQGLGGGGSYTLPVATTNALGGIKSYNIVGNVGDNPYGEEFGVNVYKDGLASVTIPVTEVINDSDSLVTARAVKDAGFITTEPTGEEEPDVPEYITKTDLDNAIAEAITNTINTPV